MERFRKPLDQGGARFLICTDAAGEGINLQFCWIMINYDVPWNPARLEQRMGRIHRYGQKHDPVVIMNLVAPSTREGKVLKVLLDKLEKIRKELQSDKVFDCIGRIFEGVSIKRYMELAVTEDADEVALQLDGRLTKEQIEAVAKREKSLYGTGGDVAKELPRLRASMEQEVYFRLMPGYIRQYIQQAAPLVDIEIDGDMDGVFSLRSLRFGAMDPLLPVLELYPEKSRDNFSVVRPTDRKDVIWLHPGEPVFERFRALTTRAPGGCRQRAARSSSIRPPPSPTSSTWRFFRWCARPTRSCPTLPRKRFSTAASSACCQQEGAEICVCPVEHLLLLKGGHGLPASAQRLAVAATEQKELARAYLAERIARGMALERKKTLADSIPEREGFIRRGFDYQESELATARAKHSDKARSGNRKAMEALDEVKRQQRELAARRQNALAVLHREPDLIAPGEVTFVAHALVVPSSDPGGHRATRQQCRAGRHASWRRRSRKRPGPRSWTSTRPSWPAAAGLPDNPGFDLLSIRPGNEKRSIEVKGRATTGDIEVSANEWAKACNMRQDYWLYAVYNCATPNPRLACRTRSGTCWRRPRGVCWSATRRSWKLTKGV